VQYTVANQWPGGFTANIIITNTGTSALNGWTLVFTLSGSQQVTQGWNGTFTQQGAQVTVKNASYNGTIAAGGSASPGFNGSWTGSNGSPTAFTLNGGQCSIAA
jgi:cellulase/cellobiase CelA1